MSAQAARELEQALARLKHDLAAGHAPDRYDARALLIPLGELLDTAPDDAAPLVRRLGELVAPVAEAWVNAATSELALACAEHVHSVDPRYLDLPNYDFAYTRQARGRLAARLRAARTLGLAVPAELQAQVERADELLRPYLGAGQREADE